MNSSTNYPRFRRSNPLQKSINRIYSQCRQLYCACVPFFVCVTRYAFVPVHGRFSCLTTSATDHLTFPSVIGFRLSWLLLRLCLRESVSLNPFVCYLSLINVVFYYVLFGFICKNKTDKNGDFALNSSQM